MKSELVKLIPIAGANAKPCLLGVTMPICVLEGVIGYAFFNNFTVFVDRLSGTMTFIMN